MKKNDPKRDMLNEIELSAKQTLDAVQELRSTLMDPDLDNRSVPGKNKYQFIIGESPLIFQILVIADTPDEAVKMVQGTLSGTPIHLPNWTGGPDPEAIALRHILIDPRAITEAHIANSGPRHI